MTSVFLESECQEIVVGTGVYKQNEREERVSQGSRTIASILCFFSFVSASVDAAVCAERRSEGRIVIHRTLDCYLRFFSAVPASLDAAVCAERTQ